MKLTNPVSAGADPFILAYEGSYYLYATTAQDGILVQRSDDLQHWQVMGYCLKRGQSVIGNGGFWAPEITVKDGKLYMVYVADEHLAIAVANSPLGPFTQEKLGWLSERNAIDGHFFFDDDGKAYLYYVRFQKGNIICCAPLSDDLLTLKEEEETVLLTPQDEWEKQMANVCEGPFVLKRNGVYYLTYSGSHTASKDYAIGYATSVSPQGPFTRYAGNPIVKRNTLYNGPGHHSFFTDGLGQLLCVYHVHNGLTQFEPRLTCIGKAEFFQDEEGKECMRIDAPRKTVEF